VTAPREFRELGGRLRNWGRWGDDDERGTLNHITPPRLVEAAALVRDGRIFDLGLTLGESGPQIWTETNRRVNPIHLMSELGEEPAGAGPCCFVDDYVVLPLQSVTQWDALGHIHYDGRMYNGRPSSEVTVRGLRHNGIDRIGNGVAGRGILLDVARLRGVDSLEPGHAVLPDELDAAARAAGVEPRAGDIVVVRTGWWGRFARGKIDAAEFFAGEPGLGLDCAEWLHGHEAAAVAADNFGLEVVPHEDPEVIYPLHMVLIRDMGMTVGELFDLELLAADCAADGRFEFLLTAPPLKVEGGAGTPLNPLAIK